MPIYEVNGRRANVREGREDSFLNQYPNARLVESAPAQAQVQTSTPTPAIPTAQQSAVQPVTTPVEQNIPAQPYSGAYGGVATFQDGTTGYLPAIPMPATNIETPSMRPSEAVLPQQTLAQTVRSAVPNISESTRFERAIQRYADENDLLNSNVLVDESALPPVAREWLESRKVRVGDDYMFGGGARIRHENTPEDLDLVRRFVGSSPEGQSYLQNYTAQKEQIDNAVAALRSRIADMEENAPRVNRQIYVPGSSTVGQPGQTITTEVPENYRDIEQARSQLIELERLQGAFDDRDRSSIAQFGSELGRRSGEAAINASTLGISRLMQNRGLGQVLNSEDGELTREATDLIARQQSLFGGQRSIAQDIARATTDNIDFVAQFAATGGLGTALTKGAATAIANRLGGNIAARAIGQMGETVANAFVRTALMPTTLATAYRLNAENPGSFLDAYSQAFKQTFIEVGVEGLGGLGAMGGASRLFGRPTSLANRLARQTGIQGAIPEFAEEQLATVFHSAAQDGQAEWADLVDPRNQLITLGTVAMMQTPFATINAGGYAAGRANNIQQKRSIRKGYESTVQNMNALFGQEVQSILSAVNERLDADTENGIPALLMDLSTDTELTQEQGDAISKYALAYQAYSGMNQAKSENVQQVVSDVTAVVEQNVNPDMGAVVSATILGSSAPVQVVGGNIVLNEDGTINRESSDQQIFYTDEQGNRQVVSISQVEELIENIPAADAVAQAAEVVAAPIVSQQENSEIRPYEVGETVRASQDGTTSIIGQIAAVDPASGNYLVAAVTPQGIVQVPIEPRQIINEDNLRGVENGSVVAYVDETGARAESAVATSPDLYAEGLIGLENGDVVPISSVLGLAQDFVPAEGLNAGLMEEPVIDTSDAVPALEVPESVVPEMTVPEVQVPAVEWEELTQVPTDRQGNADFTAMTPIMLGSQIEQVVGGRDAAYDVLLRMQEENARQQEQARQNPPNNASGFSKYARRISDLQAEGLRLQRAVSQYSDVAQERELARRIAENAPIDPTGMSNRQFISQAYPDGAPNTYMQVLFDIINGQRFVWNDVGNSRGIARELGLSDSPGERRGYIGILASPENGGITFDDYVQSLYENQVRPGATAQEQMDAGVLLSDAEIRDIVIEALSAAPSPAAAADIVQDIYSRTAANYSAFADYDADRAVFEAEQQAAIQPWVEAEQTPLQEAIAEAEAETDMNPTDAQKEAGNYRKGHVSVQGFDISIEQPRGSVRSGVDENGNEWSQVMNNTYGYIRRTKGKDGDQIDVFIGENPESERVFVVDQVNPNTGAFDEHKVMLGFDTIDQAQAAYLSNYEDGWQGLGSITEVGIEDFRTWVDSDTQRIKPFAEYKQIQDLHDVDVPVVGEDDFVPFQTAPSQFAPISRRRFNSLISRLKRTGLASDVITSPEQMRDYLDGRFGASGANRLMSLWDLNAIPQNTAYYLTTDAQENDAREIAELVRAMGATNVNVSKSRNDFGNSTYVYGKDSNGMDFKFRLSDHSVGNFYRLVNEIHVSSAPDGISRAMATFEGRLRLSEARAIADERAKDRYERLNNAWEREREKYSGVRFLNMGRTYMDMDAFVSSHPNAINIYQKELGVSSGRMAYSYEWGERGNVYGKERPSNEHLESLLEESDGIRQMSTARGEVYGFVTPDGVVYLDGSKMNANTPIHEFGHLWNSFVRQNNPELWNRGAELIRGSEYWTRVNDNPSYAGLTEEQRMDEALAMAIGDKGEIVMTGNDIFSFAALRTWLNDVWAWIKARIGVPASVNIEDMTLSDFTDLAVDQLLSGQNLEMSADSTILANQNNLENGSNIAETGLGNGGTMGSSTLRETLGNATADSRIADVAEAGYGTTSGGATAESLRGGWNKQRFLARIEVAARENGTWIDNLAEISNTEQRLQGGYENEVYLSNDGLNVVKLNNLNFLNDDAAQYTRTRDFQYFADRVAAHNELFPQDRYDIIGFAENSLGEVSVVMSQPFVENARLATTEEADAYLRSIGFTPTALTGVEGQQGYTNGLYELSDIKPQNVLVDTGGNLRFIDLDITPVVADGLSLQEVSEMEQIKDAAVANGTFLVAPNGQPSNLTARQWLQVRTTNFKAWFGDWENDAENASKVIDENGEPLVVYHGTSEVFNEFEDRRGAGGFYFTPNEDYAMRRSKGTEIVMSVFIDIKSPLYEENSISVSEWAKDAGYDGIFSERSGIYHIPMYIVFSPNQIKSATENIGEFSTDNNDIRFQSLTGDEVAQRIRNTKPSKYNAMRDFMDRLEENWVDQFSPVRRFLDDLRKAGTTVAEHNDFYKRATHISGTVDSQLRMYNENQQQAMNDAIRNLERLGMSFRDIENYAILKHGQERNAYMRQDALNKFAESHPNATAERLARFEANLPEDYSGSSSVVEEVGMSAQDYINQFENRAGAQLINELWSTIKASTTFALNKQMEGGLLNKATVDELTARYQHYIPLRGHDAETAADRWSYNPGTGTYFAAPLIRAQGRRSRSESPFAYTVLMAYSAIESANRNILNQTMLRLARKDKSGLLGLNKAWYVKTGQDANGVDVYEVQSPDYSSNPETYRQNIEAFEERMRELQSQGLARESGERLNLGGLFIKPAQAKQHEVHVYQNGTEYVVYVNADPGIARAINGENVQNTDFGFFGRATRQMAANFTTRNPVFVLTNFSRDYIYSSSILAVKEDVRYALQFQRNIPRAADALQRYVRGNVDLTRQRDRYLNEYILNGGKTGFSQMLELQQIQRQIERDVRTGGNKTPMDYTIRPVLTALEAMNDIAENMSRLSVYITSREQGRSITQSISDAKNVTVNFNQRGAGGGPTWIRLSWVRPLYLFVNAGIQAAANFAKVAAKNPGKAAALISGYALTGMIMPFIAQLLAGDDGRDKYMQLSDWERQNNLCIHTGRGFIKIPLPHELRVFHRMGDEVFQAIFEGKDVLETAGDVFMGFADLIPANPLGAIDGSWAELMPDATKPLFQLAANQTFTGSRITNEWADPDMPGYLRIRTNRKNEPFAPAFLVKLAQGLDSMTGGDGTESGLVSPNPDVLNHIMRGYFGGLYTLSTQVLNLADKTYELTTTGNLNLKVRETPLKTFYTSMDDLQTGSSRLNSTYFRIADEVTEKFRKARDYDRRAEDGEITPETAKRKIEGLGLDKIDDINEIVKEINRLNRELKQLSGDEQNELDVIILNLKGRVVEISQENN